MPFLEEIRFSTQDPLIKLKKKKFNFDSCIQGPYPDTESNYLILDPLLYCKGLRYILITGHTFSTSRIFLYIPNRSKSLKEEKIKKEDMARILDKERKMSHFSEVDLFFITV